MRKIILVILGVILFTLLSVSILLNHVSGTLTNKNSLNNTLEKANFYDYFYDSLITLLVDDIVERGYQINTQNENSKLVKFYDDESAKKSINLYLKSLITKEHFKEKTKLTLSEMIMLINKENHNLSIDYEFDLVMKNSISNFRTLSADIKLPQLLKDVLSVQSKEILQPLTKDLGFEYTDEEIKGALDEIFPDEWIEDNLFLLHDSVVYFMTKENENFLVTIPIDDRLVIAAKVLKNKLNEDDTLYDLILKKLLNPLLENNLSDLTDFGYGITATQEEVLSVFKAIAPKDWVAKHGNALIDSSVGYLTGEKDDLSYTIDLADRQLAAANELKNFGKNKLDNLLTELPACQNTIQSAFATSSISKKNKPSCIPGGQIAIYIFYDEMIKIINDEVDKFINEQFPSKLDLTSQDVEGLIGDDSELINLKKNISDGYTLSNEDLITLFSSEDKSIGIEDIRNFLSGNITNKNLETIIGLELREFDEFRNYINQIKTLERLWFSGLIIALFIFGLVSSNYKIKNMLSIIWIRNASCVMLISALLIALIIQAIKLVDIRPYLEDITFPESINTFSKLSYELNSDNFISQIVSIKNAWIDGMFMTTLLIYILPSMIIFILSFVYIKKKNKKERS
ncbi:MAG: hypothetical protein CL748_03355 [Chloroflexi bacterium]|nr:hypothetical protein [Chloroflexota bacterium]